MEGLDDETNANRKGLDMNGNNIYISIGDGNGMTIIAGTKTDKIQVVSEMIEVASPNTADWREFISGRKEWSFSTGYLVLSSEHVTDILKTGMEVLVQVVSREGAATVVILEGRALIQLGEQNFTRGSLSQGSFQFRGIGPLINHVPITSITLNKQSTTIEVGATEQLTATVLPNNASDKSVTWSSSDTSKATVDSSGNVTGGGTTGETPVIITCTSNSQPNISANCNVTVNPAQIIPVTGITLSPSSFALTDGTETQTITPNITPSNATNKNVTWTSSDESVASVSDGVITAHRNGTCTITCTAQDGSGVSATASCTVSGLTPQAVDMTNYGEGLTQGYAFNSDGTIRTDTGETTYMTDYIPVREGDTIQYKGWTLYYHVRVVAYSDNQGTIVEKLIEDNDVTNLSTTTIIPSNEGITFIRAQGNFSSPSHPGYDLQVLLTPAS